MPKKNIKITNPCVTKRGAFSSAFNAKKTPDAKQGINQFAEAIGISDDGKDDFSQAKYFAEDDPVQTAALRK